MIKEIFKMVLCLGGSFWAAIIVTYIINKWYARPLVETNEGPHFYITKEL